MNKEIWKDIEGYEGLYQISNYGNIVSLNYNHTKKRKELICEINNGYCKIGLCKNNKTKRYMVHRLVAKAFIDNPYNKNQVNHIDGNKQNNRVDNLEWVTPKENTEHSIKNSLRKMKKIKMINKNNNEIIYVFENIIELRQKIKLNRYEHINDCCNGARKSAYGYKWEYVKE